MFKQVLADCGSGLHHFPDLKSYNRYIRDFEIYKKSVSGIPVKTLAKNHRLSESEVRRIISKVRKALVEFGVNDSDLDDKWVILDKE